MVNTTYLATVRWFACRPTGILLGTSRYDCDSKPARSCWLLMPATFVERCASDDCHAMYMTERRCWPRSIVWERWNAKERASSSAMIRNFGAACPRRRKLSYNLRLLRLL